MLTIEDTQKLGKVLAGLAAAGSDEARAAPISDARPQAVRDAWLGAGFAGRHPRQKGGTGAQFMRHFGGGRERVFAGAATPTGGDALGRRRCRVA